MVAVCQMAGLSGGCLRQRPSSAKGIVGSSLVREEALTLGHRMSTSRMLILAVIQFPPADMPMPLVHAYFMGM